ncbi:MAG: GyrI-like domain-containing protein [FCB group bacterium]|nr:GyrI-like domain-containing protein [FCB group bacterium]
MKKTILVLLTLSIFISCGKNFKEFEYLLDPQISEKPSQYMLVYKAEGDPNETVGNAFGALFSTFFNLKKDHDMDMVAPLARWPKGPNTPKDEWVGIYGMPIKASVTEIPASSLAEHPALKLDTWTYGQVAEILHIGSYASEAPTVERLHQFIKESGYEIVGMHEEEYLKGPGMFGPGNPDKYYTIIRYPVAKVTQQVKSNTVQTMVISDSLKTVEGVE